MEQRRATRAASGHPGQQPTADSATSTTPKDVSSPREPRKHGTKRSQAKIANDLNPSNNTEEVSPQKRLRPIEAPPFDGSTNNYNSPPTASKPITNSVLFWAQEGKWPKECFEPQTTMEHLLARKRSLSYLNRKRSSSATSITPSDQRPREEKSAQYRDPRYTALLETKASFMAKSSLDITAKSKAVCAALLNDEASVVPGGSLFHDDFFEATCSKIDGRNEARIIQDITRLIVPSAETFATRGAQHLVNLIESVNECWNNAIPLAGSRPQPDYAVGFRRNAFNEDQLTKLSPFIGDFIGGDHSFFMATYYMYFPFLTCEVKCGAAALDIADRQNAHSMTLAVRAVTELFRAAKREAEVHREILGFSISHDHRSVRIYGHYPVIDGKDTKYYRHPIHEFSFTALDGKEKWTAYRFTKNVYDSWIPSHFNKICSVIDELPANLDFDSPSTGLSQSVHNLSQSDVESISNYADQGNQSDFINPGRITPTTLPTDSGQAKKRRGKK